MKGKLFFVGSESKDAIDALRMAEYGKAKGFSLDLATLRWKASDDQSFIMAAESEGRIVSTMRGEVIDDLALLEKKLECPWSFDAGLRMPVMLLSRAATSFELRRAGFNLLLRYHFLKMARAHAIPFVVGTFVAGSPRENTLREMGYQFFENTLGWQQSTYRSLAPVQVVLLDMERDGERAIGYCEERLNQEIRGFQMEERYPEMKIVRTL